jgi:hypothetical protein
MIISVVTVLSLAIQDPDATGPADWQCAQPLINRNYARSVDARELALRIAEECARPYSALPRRSVAPGGSEQAESIFGSQDRAIYRDRLTIFVSEIEDRIDRARRRDALPLD